MIRVLTESRTYLLVGFDHTGMGACGQIYRCVANRLLALGDCLLLSPLQQGERLVFYCYEDKDSWVTSTVKLITTSTQPT
jgi:hypothetical protein